MLGMVICLLIANGTDGHRRPVWAVRTVTVPC